MSQTSEPTEHAIGAHSLRIEPPDLFIIRHIDDMSATDIVSILNLVDEFLRGKTAAFAIIDLSRAGTMSSDTRRKVLVRLSQSISGIAFISTSLVSRVGISLGYKAHLMMSRGQEVSHTFAADEAEARSWIDAQRRRLRNG